MTLDLMVNFFAWCSLINVGFLLLWALMLMTCKDAVFRLHTRLFLKISKEQFSNAHYLLIGFFKLMVVIFNVVPFVVLKFFSS
jgi:hypothetical protein